MSHPRHSAAVGLTLPRISGDRTQSGL